MRLHSYWGQLLVVDLTERRSWHEDLPHQTLAAFVGGTGLASYLLYRFAPAGVDPLDPENPLIFVNSPLAGTAVTTSSKYTVVAKSPLTGCIGDSLSSSHLAIELKKTGFDALVLLGQCEEWTYLEVRDGQVAFHDASTFLGLDPAQVETSIKGILGDRRLRVASIGVAGERLVRFATISNDGRHAGRTGTGAVMGSKRLKAIAVRGSGSVTVADQEGLEARRKALARASLGHATEKYRTMGTTANISVFNRLAALPSYNFRQSTFEGAEEVSGERLAVERHERSLTCASCTIGCEHLFRSTPDSNPSRLEYESLYALGPLCGVSDLDAVLQASALCDRYGMDTISTGGTIAWAIESAERGLLSAPELRFGRADAILEMIHQIATREGYGDLLAEGSRRAAASLGGGSEMWAMQVKGLEMPGYEPRSLKTMALGLAVGSRGACHNRSTAYEVDFSEELDRLRPDARRGLLAAASEDRSAVIDSLILCKFVRGCFQDFYPEAQDLYRLVTGLDVDLREAGERITTMKKIFNLREGWRRSDDTLPPRVLAEPLSTGVAKDVALSQEELDEMISSYYAARGWTPEGDVPKEKLAALGLDSLR